MHREIRGPVIEALIEQGIFNARSVLVERTIHQWSAGGVLIPFEEVPSPHLEIRDLELHRGTGSIGGPRRPL